MRAVMPPLEPLPDGADNQLRREAFRKYQLIIVAENPKMFLRMGVRRRWWHLRLEHPLTNTIRGANQNA